MIDRPIADTGVLAEREQDRLDGLLRRARGFHTAAYVAAAMGIGVAWRARSGTTEIPDWAVVAALLVVVALCVAALRLQRAAGPYLPLDPRRPPFAWVGSGIGPAASLRAIVHLLLPVVLLGGAAAYPIGAGAPQLILLFAPTLLALMPRAIDHC